STPWRRCPCPPAQGALQPVLPAHLSHATRMLQRHSGGGRARGGDGYCGRGREQNRCRRSTVSDRIRSRRLTRHEPMSSTRYLELLEQFSSRRIGVVGDFLLDQYILGTSARVSREAPIVVVDYQDTVYHPGGAANAAQNVTALGAAARAVGVIGTDREADALTRLLEARGVDVTHLMREASAATSTKLRIMAGEMNAQKQQVARVDRSYR